MDRQRLEQFEFRVLDRINAGTRPALHAFFRRTHLSHIFDEIVVPALENKQALLSIATTTRPWPRWGLGGKSVAAIALATPLHSRSAGLAAPILIPDEHMSIGLAAAVHLALLTELESRAITHVHHVVREHAYVTTGVLGHAGFTGTSQVVVDAAARYWVCESSIAEHKTRLGMAAASTDEMLLTDAAWKSDAQQHALGLYLMTVSRALEPWLLERGRRHDLIIDTGPGIVAECAPPGGPPPVRGGLPDAPRPI